MGVYLVKNNLINFLCKHNTPGATKFEFGNYNNKTDMKYIFNAGPFKSIGSNKWEFIHLSIRDFIACKYVYENF